MKKIVAALIALTLIFGLSACNGKQANNSEVKETSTSEEKIKVIVSFNPIKEFVLEIGGNKVDVETIIPEGSEPHDFEPKVRDIAALTEADIFIYNGLGMESWVDKVLNSIDKKTLTIVEASKGCEAIKISDPEEIKEHGEYDPHIWLSLKEAQKESKNIKDALIMVDFKNKDYYEKNYENFIKELNSLYDEYKKKFDTVSNRCFVTGHAAFGYLCRDFNLNQNSVEDVFAEGEPSGKKMKELVDFCKANNVKTVFLEEMASPKVSETLANEIGAKVEKIYTIASKEDNKNYIQSMRENLEKIYNSLK
ncbi:ABC transporter substrate-binding protein [Fervidicella metallireducens AeB]|uniref:ABC transporter substrate-binding protein n=1 Tax=Fervidicella metallireducens AeB TaxID=1403537 RepID=A0A017RRR5_9CLOT|nr:metal ABC transporter substrate-binding protein [Fervidicella metallireducens]EYE87291.1 ABC transporter substrate-binding protein [Fervidicella metallireducens AeB]